MDRLCLETEKLALYVGERAEITTEDVRAAASPSLEATIFELTDAVGRKDLAAALTALPSLLPAQSPESAALMILAMLARQLRLIWQARFLAEQGYSLGRLRETPPELAEVLPVEHNIVEAVKGRGFLVDKLSDQARRYTDAELAVALERVTEVDAALKGQTDRRLGARLALEMLLVDLCRPELAPEAQEAAA
jgi:DNA polymerase-3 subunit delta